MDSVFTLLILKFFYRSHIALGLMGNSVAISFVSFYGGSFLKKSAQDKTKNGVRGGEGKCLKLL